MIGLLKNKKTKNAKIENEVTVGHNDKSERVTKVISDSFTDNSRYEGRSMVSYSFTLLSAISKEKEISQGAFYLNTDKEGKQVLK